ncbi:hypothetical protein EI94DRAFT_1732775 [Lactarius quietus]|nr:hypothetical protein EI94DRAFT_1732775 [Lactarius quietus]
MLTCQDGIQTSRRHNLPLLVHHTGHLTGRPQVQELQVPHCTHHPTKINNATLLTQTQRDAIPAEHADKMSEFATLLHLFLPLSWCFTSC